MDRQKAVRKPNRLPAFDYSRCGGYFITICTAAKHDVLCRIRETESSDQPCVELTALGKIAQNILENQSAGGIVLEKYVIMPNHIHLLLLIPDAQADQSVSDFVGRFKSMVATHWLKVCKANGMQMGPLWQRSFHDHVIRNQADHSRIWLYIEGNPSRWTEDCFYPGR